MSLDTWKLKRNHTHLNSDPNPLRAIQTSAEMTHRESADSKNREGGGGKGGVGFRKAA